MKKLMLIMACLTTVAVLGGCTKCETEPMVQENHKLIVPKNFGNMPK